MVMPGQFLERPTLVQVGDLVMEGLSHRGRRRPPLLVLPPRPGDGGGMDFVIGAELGFALAKAGHPTLRFNHRGVGASQGVAGSGDPLVEDALAALTLASENAGGARPALVAAGGACEVALEVLRRHPERLAGVGLISPLTVTPEQLPAGDVPLLLVVGSEEPTHGRLALATRVLESGGQFELIEGADATWARGLTELGHAVVRWFEHQLEH